jgi:hypothetical protein
MIWWVFGGTAVGKKRFIAEMVATAGGTLPIITDRLRGAWIQDGDLTEDLLGGGDVLVRWQWGREETLVRMLRDYPRVVQEIMLLSVPLGVQVARVHEREGELKWDEQMLAGEDRDIHELVHALSAEWFLPVTYLDATAGYEVRRRVVPQR